VSQQNVKVVVASIDAYNVGEIDRMLRFYAVDREVIPDSSFLEIERLHGRQSIRERVLEIGSAWRDSARYEIAEARGIGADRVLVRGDWGGTGHGSGLDIASNFSGVFTLRDGQTQRIEYLQDHATALKAAGLEE
jgi:hypothetical protein